MATIKSFACVADARIHSSGQGAGKSDQTPVGFWNVGLTGVYRGLIKFATPDWTGLRIRRITAATLRVRNSSQTYVARGGTPRMLVKRCTSNWSEGSSDSLSSSNAVTYANQPSTTTTGQTDTGTLFVANDVWMVIDILAIARAWAPKTVENGLGLPNYGIALYSFDEASLARTTEIYARETMSDPVLILTYETNTTPAAPTSLSPAAASDGSAVVLPLIWNRTSSSGGALSSTIALPRGLFKGTRSDPDPGDYITGAQVQIYADTATDATPGATLIDFTDTSMTGTPTTFALEGFSLSSLVVGTTYRWRARTRDKELQWGAWSSLLSGRFIPNTVPGLSNLAVDTGSATPNFYGTLVDPDASAAFSEVSLEVAQDTTAGTLVKWASGGITTAGTRFVIAYAGGQQLEFGVTYKWRAKAKDNIGSESAWTGWQAFTPRQIIGPDNMTPRTIETKQATLTPTLTIAHSVAFTAYELEVAKYGDGTTVLWDVPVTTIASATSVARTYAGLTLDWGRIYYWRAKILVGGVTWSEWSPWYPFYINARPDAPVVTVDSAVDTGNSITDSTNAVWRYSAVVGTQPTIRAPFTDPDRTKGYTDNPTRRAIEVRNAITGAHVAGSPFVITTSITDTFVIGAGVLVAGTVYKTRAQYDDGANQRSDWSPYTYFKPVTALTITAGTAPAVADPSPTFAWTLGRTQKALQVLVKNSATGELVHDSELVTSATTSYTMPGEILQSGVTYAFQVTAYDTDMISATLAYTTWTTAFTTPAALASLTATPDLDSSAIVLSWPASALGALFWRYYVYRRNADTGEFERIGSVDVEANATFTDAEAPHGVSVEYAVTVSNGWAESDSVTGAALVDLKWWIVNPLDPGLTFELRYVESFSDRLPYEQDSFEPLDRPTPLVVSGQQLPSTGTLSVKLLPADAGLRSLVRRATLVDPWIVLKTPFGDVYRVKFGDIGRDRGQAGNQQLNLAYRTVA